MISSIVNRVTYAGDGSSATFVFPYEFFSQTDLKVYFFNSSTQQATLQVLNTNYTVGGTANAQGVYTQGGSAIVNCAVPSSLMVVMFRDPSQVQNYSLIQNGQINSTALVQQLDYLTLLCQRLQDQCSRSVRLADGFGATFDPTLPMNAGASPAKFLVTNSSATGWVFSDTNGVSYIPNCLVYSPDAVSIASLGGSPAGMVLTSNGSSAPGWSTVSLSGSSVSGNLGLSNGGTGGLVPQEWGVVFCSSATQLATTDPGPVGFALVANASSAPTFQKINLAFAGSGIVPFVNGGTGLATLTQYALLYAQSAAAIGQIPSATAGLVLTANGSSAPTFQSVPAGSSALLIVNNLSDLANKATAIQNISPTTTRGDFIFAGSAAVVGRFAAGAAGTVLTSQGTQADPTWTSPLTNPMSTLGDIITGGAAGAATRLAGNISNSSAILVQTGSGAASATPAWKSVGAPKITLVTAVGSSVFVPSQGLFYFIVEGVAGGGGGGPSGTGSSAITGTVGGNLIFGSSVLSAACIAIGGAQGPANYQGFAGGGGGIATGGDLVIFGSYGQNTVGNSTPAVNSNYGVNGGNSALGGGGLGGVNGGGAGGIAAVNTGGGGGSAGGGSTFPAAAAGGGGGYFRKVIVPVGSSYPISLPDGGSGGTAGTTGGAGGKGGSGLLVITEYFI